jgi:molybdopterin converting factor small subunit
MKITVTFVGVLGELIRKDSLEVHLPPEATYGDLLKEIGSQFGQAIPDPLWDRQANKFREPIFAMAKGGAVDSPDLPLKDGEEIRFLTLVAGG